MGINNVSDGMETITPGKLFLLGEYAVLFGAPAVIMSIDRYASCSMSLKDKPVSPLIKLIMARYKQWCHKNSYRFDDSLSPLHVDTSSFYHQKQKLGLGSSAATTIATLAWLHTYHGFDIQSQAVKKELWTIAKPIHDEFQGRAGSGGDLASCLYGESIVFRNVNDEALVDSFMLPVDFQYLFFWSKQSASTKEYLTKLDQASRHNDASVVKVIDHMSEIMNPLTLTSVSFIEVVQEYNKAMSKLGDIIALPIITQQMESLFAVISNVGGAAKPSGAGGGDCIFCVIPKHIEKEDVMRAADKQGFEYIDFKQDPYGTRYLYK